MATSDKNDVTTSQAGPSDTVDDELLNNRFITDNTEEVPEDRQTYVVIMIDRYQDQKLRDSELEQDFRIDFAC